MKHRKFKAIKVKQKDNPKLYKKLYYQIAVKPHIKPKGAKFLVRGVCGLCGMNFRPKNLSKPQSLRFKVIAFGGRGKIRWLDYSQNNIPEDNLIEFRKGILTNISSMLINLNLTDEEKQLFSTILDLQPIIYEKNISPSKSHTPDYVRGSNPSYSITA